jgi:hypothetical protein
VPQRPGLRPEAPRASPWRATPPPADQFGGAQYASGQPGYVNGDLGYADGQPGYIDGDLGYAGRDRGYAIGQRNYLSGQPGYADNQRGYAGDQSSADPMRSLYPDSQADEEPRLDDSRGPRLDGPWWDPDSWSGWRHWLIPVGVAVLAAAIGAALVLLTGMHSGASAAVGPARTATTASPAANRTPAP